ncbi:MAG: hypothetical protein GWP14_03245 [Actinobacteria bacterium]|nr:hypothetical protein [Actinomycetota bacterium]
MSAPIFYPPSPDAPRLQFLVSFSDVASWLERGSPFADFVVGAKQEKRGSIKSPYGIAARDGRLYICDLGLRLIHVIDLPRKSYGVLGTPDQIRNPVNITIDADGTKYVCDTGKRMVAVFDAEDRFLRYLGDPQRCVPIDLAIFGDELFVVDIAGAKVEVWSKEGKFLRTIATKGRGPDQLRRPTNLAVDQRGHVFVTDTALAMVKEYSSEGQFIKTIGGPGNRPGYFARPKGIAIDPQGRLYVADAQWDIVQAFSSDGQLLIYFGGAGSKPEGMGLPAGLAIDATSLNVFRRFVSKDFEAEYLLFVVNQFGTNKIGVYAFGHRK